MLSAEMIRRWGATGQLYAILDACDAPAVPLMMHAMGPTHAVSLYRRPADEQFSAIAPYLVCVDDATMGWIEQTLANTPWGILAFSPAGMDRLRAHFRKFLLVESPEGDEWYFRFYDPRVLAQYLPTCTNEELAEFFGPITRFGVASETGEMTQFWLDGAAQTERSTPVVIRVAGRPYDSRAGDST